MRRTIILLSAKRCGSTALFRVFQKHPQVSIPHVDAHIANWEPNFWNLAACAIKGDSRIFIERLKASNPFLSIPSRFDEQAVFTLWEAVLGHYGLVVFDKSPQYLGDQAALELILKYRALGNDVRLFALIRDPRDVIASQYELWGSRTYDDSPQKREQHWLNKYFQLEMFQRHCPIPVFRYEDLFCQPKKFFPGLFQYCGLEDIPRLYEGIKPRSLYRYSASMNRDIRAWPMGPQFKEYIIKYGYKIPQLGFKKRFLCRISWFPRNCRQGFVSLLKQAKGRLLRRVSRNFPS